MVFTGYVKGTSYNNGNWEVKTLGTRESGAILLGLGVSGKDKDGNRIYGKSVEIKVNIKSEAEGGRVMGIVQANEGMVEFDGFFVPNNYTNKEGKEVKGNQVIVSDSTSFRLAGSTPTAKPKQAVANDEIPDNEVPW